MKTRLGFGLPLALVVVALPADGQVAAAVPAPTQLTPGDTCTAATHEIGPVRYGPIADSTTGAPDDFDLPTDILDPTCTASTPCAGGGWARGLISRGLSEPAV